MVVVVAGADFLTRQSTKHTSDRGNPNAHTWATLKKRMAFLLYGNFMPISPTDPFKRAATLFFQLGAASGNSSRGVKVEDKTLRPFIPHS